MKKHHNTQEEREIEVKDLDKEVEETTAEASQGGNEAASAPEDAENAGNEGAKTENEGTEPEGGSTNAESEEEKEPTAEEKLEAAEQEIARLKDLYLRSVAEFDNFRRRTLKEKSELILNGGARVIENLLPVLDDLERAEANMSSDADVDTLRQGVELIAKKLTDTLAHQGLKRMETEGATFDTDYHEAIALVPTDDDEKKGKVIDCVATGYMLNDRVLRHAKVVVGQ